MDARALQGLSQSRTRIVGAVEVAITSPERGDEARLLSSFLGWLDRHFGEQLSSINIQYQHATPAHRRR
jgi:hypothetical protein